MTSFTFTRAKYARIAPALAIAVGALAGGDLVAGPLPGSLPLVIPADQDGSNFGNSLSSVGDVNGDGLEDVVVGAFWSSNGEAKEGRAFLYLGQPGGVSTVPAWAAESNQADSWFGYSVDGAGDVNGDGFADIVVGAFRYTAPLVNQGRAFLYLGSPTGPHDTPDWTADGDRSGAEFAGSVAGAGDVNGDGFDDVIVGEPAGPAAFLYLGSATGLGAQASWVFRLPDDLWIQQVNAAGDVNGDGYDDVILGVTSYSNGQTNEGAAMVFHGSPTGLPASPSWIVEGNLDNLFFGYSVAGVGDVNADGFADVIVGTYLFTGAYREQGKAWLYLGGNSGLSTTPAWSAEGKGEASWLGFNVSGAGDVDGDGHPDVAIAARNEGRVYLFLGTATGLAAAPAWDTGYSGGSVAAEGADFDDDGYSDVLVGSGAAAHIHMVCSHPPVADAGADIRARVRQPVTFDASGTRDGTPPLSYEWDVDGDGLADASGRTAQFTFNRPGNYMVTLRVIDVFGCVGSDTLIVTTKGNPTPAP